MVHLFSVATAFLIGFVLCSTATAQVSRPVVEPTEVMKKAESALETLIREHPHPEVSKTLDRWIRDKRVYLSFSGDSMPPDITVNFSLWGKRRVPVLVANPDFLLSRRRLSRDDEKVDRELILFHEYVHLRDHFSGTIKLRRQPRTESEITDYAKFLWRSESSAFHAQWHYARERGLTHLMPWFEAAIYQYGEKRGMLEAVHRTLSENVLLEKERLRKVWGGMYRAELAKLTK